MMVNKLINQMKIDLDNGLIPARIFADPEIYMLELSNIFGHCWIYVGHETEIPNPGDYRLRYIAEDQFIFVRDSEGNIRVLFNGCRHRGGGICRTDVGNTSYFTCPYHGWTYKNSGELVGVPARLEGYRQLDLSKWGLLAPRVESYCGMVFANLDPTAPSLVDYLGGFKWYLDIQFRLTAEGMEVIGEPHRWLVDANWKSGAENFCGDSSHTQMTHRSLFQLGLVETVAVNSPGQVHGLHASCDGHSISIRQVERGRDYFWGYPIDIISLFRQNTLDRAQYELARRAVVHDGTVFPNLSFIHIGYKVDETKQTAAFLSLRVWQPRGPRRMEIWSWILAPREAPEEYKRRAYRAGMSSFSPSGSFEQDDVTVWSWIPRSAGSLFAQLNNIKFNYQMGMSGMSAVEPLSDWPGPGVAWPSNAGESGLREFYRSWIRWMMRSYGG